MAKFRKKPVEIEAVRFLPNHEHWDWNILTKFFGTHSGEGVWQSISDRVVIHTLEGRMTCNDGDWIIKGVEGEFYPCKNMIFEQTYEQI